MDTGKGKQPDVANQSEKEKRIVYIPQGRSGRLNEQSAVHGVKGLYTDGFSTCNVIACIGKTKMVLIHADQFTNPRYIADEINWVDEPRELLVIIRKGCGEHVFSALTSHPEVKGLKFPIKYMDKGHDGVYLSFIEQPESDIHTKIKKYEISKRPDNLIHHPDEQIFLAVQKIEQVIGLRAKSERKSIKTKKMLIFEGHMWLLIPPREKEINKTHPKTHREINNFKKGDCFVIIAGKLRGMIKYFNKTIQGTLNPEDVMSIATYLEWYVNKPDDADALFRRNMLSLLSKDSEVNIYKLCNPKQQDKPYLGKLKSTLSKPEEVFDAIAKIINEYKINTSSSSSFKKQLLSEFATFAHHYNDRLYYYKINKAGKEKFDTAKNFYRKGTESFQKKDYQAASNLYIKAFDLFCLYRTQGHENIPMTMYMLGICQKKLGIFSDALFFFNNSLTMYKVSGSTSPFVAKCKNGIAACEAAISQEKKQQHHWQPKRL